MTAAALQDRNRRVGLIALGGALAMLGLGYASVPLYQLFCQVTGLGGTTQRASEAEADAVKVGAGKILIRFDGNVANGMEWQFGPEQVRQEVRFGARNLTFFSARNQTDHAITGVATFNVAPEAAGKYFNKVHCFCFNQQTLQPYQQVRMPVQYYVDPAILDDPDAKGIQEITLSYTFHEVAKEAAKPLDPANPAG